MIKPNHPIAAFLFATSVMPLFVLGIVVGLVWRSVGAGLEAADRFIKWL